MPGKLYQYLADDHARLDALLQRAAEKREFDMEAYAAFRVGLLRHIGIEEKIVMPAIARFQKGEPAAVAKQLHLDHGALVALLVPPPSASIIQTMRSIFESHNPMEEQPDGLYMLLEKLAGDESERLYEQMKSAPDVPVVRHNPGTFALEAAHRAVARAGHAFIELPE